MIHERSEQEVEKNELRGCGTLAFEQGWTHLTVLTNDFSQCFLAPATLFRCMMAHVLILMQESPQVATNITLIMRIWRRRLRWQIGKHSCHFVAQQYIKRKIYNSLIY